MQIFVVHSTEQVFGAYQTINQAMETAEKIEYMSNFSVTITVTQTTLQTN